MKLIQTFQSDIPRESYIFVLASLVNSVGSALMWPLTTIYVHNVLHRSYTDAGFSLLLQAGAGILGQIIGGALYQRIGAKRLIVGSLLFTGLAQFSVIFAKAWIPYLIVMSINGFLIAVTMPAVNAFIGFRWPEVRTQLFNLVYVMNNVGVAIGTTLAGILAMRSFNLTFLFNSFSTLGFAVFFVVFLKRMQGTDLGDWTGGLVTRRDRNIRALLHDYRLYLFVGLGSMLVFLSTSAWNSGVAPFLNNQGDSPAKYSFLWTVNGIVILVGQPFTSWLNRVLTKKLISRLVASALFYALAFGLIHSVEGSYTFLMIGMVIGTFGEMLISPTIPALVSQTTGRHAAFYLGIVGGFGSLGRLVGPLLFGHIFDHAGLAPILIIAVITTTLAAASFFTHHMLTRATTFHAPTSQQM